MSSAEWREFDQTIADEICEEVGSSSLSLQSLINANTHWPQKSTIYKWLARNKGFAENYAAAKVRQAEILVDEIIEISDDRFNDSRNNDKVNRDRLRVDSRKWAASHLKPKNYGDRMHVAGVKDEPLEFSNVTVEDANKRLAELAAIATSRSTDDKSTSE